MAPRRPSASGSQAAPETQAVGRLVLQTQARKTRGAGYSMQGERSLGEEAPVRKARLLLDPLGLLRFWDGGLSRGLAFPQAWKLSDCEKGGPP